MDLRKALLAITVLDDLSRMVIIEAADEMQRLREEVDELRLAAGGETFRFAVKHQALINRVAQLEKKDAPG